jgi:hypothetical protein
MIVLCMCADCGFERDQPLAQPGASPIPPRAGDFWLCSDCGSVHCFRQMLMTIADELVLVALPAFPEEFSELPPADLQAMLSKRAEILKRRRQAAPEQGGAGS